MNTLTQCATVRTVRTLFYRMLTVRWPH